MVTLPLLYLLFTATPAKGQGLTYIVNYSKLYRHRTIVYVYLESIYNSAPKAPRLNWNRAISTTMVTPKCYIAFYYNVALYSLIASASRLA